MAVCPLVVRRLYFHRTKLETGAWLWVSRHVAMKSYGQKAWWRQGTIAFFYNIAVWKEGRLMVVLSLKANVQFCLWNSSSFYSFLAYGLNFLCENRKKKWQVNIGHSIREWVLFNFFHVFLVDGNLNNQSSKKKCSRVGARMLRFPTDLYITQTGQRIYWSFSFSKYLTLHKNSIRYNALYRTEMGKNCFKYFSIAIRTLWIKVDS